MSDLLNNSLITDLFRDAITVLFEETRVTLFRNSNIGAANVTIYSLLHIVMFMKSYVVWSCFTMVL